MLRVYQRARIGRRVPCAAHSWLVALAIVTGLLAACGAPAAPRAARTAQRRVPAESIVDSRSYELVAVASRPPRLIADERSATGVRAVAVAVGGGAPVALAASEADESRALAALPAGQVVIEEIVGGSPRLVLVGPAARRILLAPLDTGRERWLGIARDGRRFWTASRPSGLDPERLIETQLPNGGRRALETVDAPFTVAALSADGDLAAFRRRIHDEADELVLADRRTGERRLLLPERDDGRFRALEFLGDGRFLLLLADDGGDRDRLELLELATGRRRRVAELAAGCAVAGARLVGGAALRLDLVCRGKREARRVSLGGRALPLPALPSGLVPSAFLPLPGRGALALAAANVVASDLWTWLPADGMRPLTYGAAPALELDGFARAEAITIGPNRLPAELWKAPSGQAGSPGVSGGVLWLEEGRIEPRWEELEPTLAALVQGGYAVLRTRTRGADGFGRGLRRAADGDPGGAALDDIAAALAALAERLPSSAPLAAVGLGGWESAALLAALGGDSAGSVHAAVALFPDPDPFAPLDLLAETSEPARSWLVARWGDPSNPALAARRERWRFPVDVVQRPTLIVLDAGLATTVPLAVAVETAAAAGRPVELAIERRPALGASWSKATALRLVEFLGRHLSGASPSPAVPR